jgi:hypothetical protein
MGDNVTAEEMFLVSDVSLALLADSNAPQRARRSLKRKERRWLARWSDYGVFCGCPFCGFI